MNNRLLEQFLLEARELLEGIGADLMQLERTPGDTEVMGALFRRVHTLKGNSGLFEFREMTRVLHAAEDLMDAVRDLRIGYSDALADRLLEAMDFVALLCDSIEQTGDISAEQAAPSAALAEALRVLLQQSGAGERHGTIDTATVTAVDIATLPPDARHAAAEAGQALTHVVYTPDRECFFQGTDPLHLAMQTPGVVWAAVDTHTPIGDVDAMDAYACLLRFQLLSSADADALAEHFRYEVDTVAMRSVAVPAFAAVTELSAETRRAIELLRTQHQLLTLPVGDAWYAGRFDAIVATCLNVARSLAQDTACKSLKALVADGSRNAAAVQSWIDTFVADLQPSAAVASAIESAASVTERRVSTRRADDAITTQKSVKVDQEKIDRLMNLIGEMVVARNALPYLADRAETVYGSREMAREIKAQYAVMNRITEEMQDAIMQVRMMPVSMVFQRFPRLVRDISRQLGKDVELVLDGEDTAADKTIIEAIGDPLIHILRNSLDHGFEQPEERIAAGKPATGTLMVQARQEADRVVVEIRDDGRGIDPARVRRKAVERGIIDESAAERLTDADAVNLVFAAGFSTAEVISDLSGRGVGMDVVRSAIERVNGSVALQSTVGVGTTIRLALPLSMAVTKVIVVESDGQQFGVPMDAVVETVRVPRIDVKTIRQQQATVLRGEVVPLVPVTSALHLDAEPMVNDHDEVAVLVTRSGGDTVGLLVDDFRETIDVILKPLGGVLSGLSAYAGSALMGDGSVLMVLNPRALYT